MNILPCTLFLLLLTSAFHPPSLAHPDANTARTDRHPRPAGTACTVNACFALDGSASISQASFRNEIELVGNIVHLLSTRGTRRSLFSGVQYATANHAITPLTGDVRGFQTALKAVEKAGGEATFLTGGITYCFRQLFERGGRKVMVVLGDGREGIGSPARERAALFERGGGRVFTVGVGGGRDRRALVAIAGGDGGRYFEVRRGGELVERAREVVRAVCA